MSMNIELITYKCPCCTVEYDENEADHDAFVGAICPECSEELKATGTRPAAWFSIGLYNVTRDYGGPEEGGWYYESGSLILPTLRCFEDMAEAEAYRKQLVGDGLPRDQKVKVYLERLAPLRTPEHRPFYC